MLSPTLCSGYREARKDWSVVPFEQFIRWAKQRSDYVIGDFGCGEAKVAEALADAHTVHCFDYVAMMRLSRVT